MSITAQNKEALCAFAKKNSVNFQQGFINFTRNIREPDALVFDIERTEDLQKIIRLVNQLNKKKKKEERITLRAAAGGRKEIGKYSLSYSMTPCATADVIVRLVGDDFKKVKLVNKEKNIIRAGASLQIGELDKLLYEQLKRSLPTSSLVPHVTVAGLSATAGHGTGRDWPSFAGLIHAITVCRPDGKIVRIDKSHPDFAVICGAHLGLFGIILDVELECIPAKKLQSVIEARTINELVQLISDGLFHKSSYVSAMYIPTYQRNERNERNVALTRWEPVSLDLADNNCSNPTLVHFGQELSVRLCDFFNIPDFLARHKNLIPSYMKYIMSHTIVGKTDTIAVGPWHEIAHARKSYPWNLDDAGYLFRVKDKNCQEIIKAIDYIEKTLAEYAKKNLFPVIDAIYLRLFSGTSGGLSSSPRKKDEYICALDIVSSDNTPGYKNFKKDTEKFFSEELEAKPHWGKTIPLDKDYAAMYGDEFKKFIEVLRRWHQDCGMELTDSPLLTDFFSQILQLTPTPSAKEEQEEKAPAFDLTLPSHVMAKKLLDEVKKDEHGNPHAQEFKRNLERIISPDIEPDAVRFHFHNPKSLAFFMNTLRLKDKAKNDAVMAAEIKPINKTSQPF